MIKTEPFPLASLNGQLMPLADVVISASDRGFLFGDAVYEVIRVYAGKPWLMDEHVERLGRSLEAVRIKGVDLHQLRKRVMETVAAAAFEEATVYIQVTRGAATRDHSFPQIAAPLELIAVSEFKDTMAEFRAKGTSVITYPDIRWGRCDIKSTNLLANVLAIQEAKERGAVEAVFYLPDGTITEGARMSFFAVQDGRLLTTPQSPAILPGITRSFVLSLAQAHKVPLLERTLKISDLPDCSELFLTGTTSEVLPIVRVDDRVVGDGQPGPITRQLQRAFSRSIRK